MNARPLFVTLIVVLASFGVSAQSSGKLVTDPLPAVTVYPRERSIPAPGNPVSGTEENTPKSEANKEKPAGPETTTTTVPDQFRVEVLPIVGGAELLTIFGRLDGLKTNRSAPEVPLISVLRDTLSDSDPENDRLSYVWMLTYTRPNLLKRAAAAVPFLYQHVGNQSQAPDRAPKPILDLSNPTRQTWNRFFWTGMQNIFLDTYGIPLKASSRTYRQNASDYRAGHVMQALSILDSYERLRQRSRDEGELLALGANNPRSDDVVTDSTTPLIPKNAFRPGEMLEMRARLILSAKTLGGLLGPDVFPTMVIKRTMNSVDNSGHNWEILRQRAEAEGLYFEPLTMPDGFATHAILWVAKSDLEMGGHQDFQHRFLNISNPWADDRLRKWSGYTRTSWFDAENRRVNRDEPGAHPVEMIPLAVYGLDHPKIPALLVDFRDSLNPKKREMSRRLFSDLAKNVFSLSSFGNLPYFAGKQLYDFVTGRRGMDVNQPTRLRSYSELKLLLSFNPAIDDDLRAEIERRIQNVSLNPLNNDNASELQLAREQYEALVDYARRPDGLSARVERDRRAEMVPLEHGKTARFFYNLGNVLTFGRYVHRENATPELTERLELTRRVEYHTQLLKQIEKSSPQMEIAWDLATVKHSLRVLAAQGSAGKGSAAKAVAGIFEKTNDAETRQLCLEALSKINNKTARSELLRIYQQQQLQPDMRADIAVRLRQAVAADERIKPAEAKSLLSQVGTP